MARRRGRGIAKAGGIVALLLFLAWLLELPGGTWPSKADEDGARLGGQGNGTEDAGRDGARPEPGSTASGPGATAEPGTVRDPGAVPGAAGTAPASDVNPPLDEGPPPEDWLAGQREAFRALMADDEVAQARSLVRRLEAQASPDAEALAAELARVLDRRLHALEESFREAWERDDLAAAERALVPIRKGFAERAEALCGAPVAAGRVQDEELAELAAALGDVLPRILDARRTLVRLQGREAVVRVPGTQGGRRDLQVTATELDPRAWFATLDAAGALDRCVVLARLYAAEDRPLAAALALRGRLPLPPPLPDPGR